MLEGRELEVAAVAARLKDFHAQPERFAPRYLQGLETLPDGGILLRFAQGKVPAVLLDANDVEGSLLRAAANEFVRRVCLWDHADHYQVLCARRDAGPEKVKENYHLLMALLHPDRQESGSRAWPEACAQRVNSAYDVLGDEKSRREYDMHLRAMSGRARVSLRSELRRGGSGVRLAKGLVAVGAVVSALIVAGLVVDDDEWGDRSALQASLSRLRTHPAPGSNAPRYVGSAVAASPRASDAVYDDPEPFALLKPLMRAITAEEPKPWAPPPQPEAPASQAATPISAEAQAIVPPAATANQQPAPAPPVLRATSALRAIPAATIAPAPLAVEKSGATSRQIEDLIVALVDSYQAGDTERLLGLLEPDTGFWRTVQLRRAYSDFFGATRARRLRIEKLAWNAQAGAAQAKGEATVVAEYFDQAAPVERRVAMQLDIVLLDGQARIRRLSLFPSAP